MKEYHKIETLYDRDEKFRVIPGKWRLPEFEYLKDNQWIWTEKVDGTNIRIIWDGEKLTFGGKTDNASIPAFLVNKLQGLFSPEKIMSVFQFPVCLYGEGYGAKIQKGGGNYNPKGVDFVLFDVLVDKFWLERENLEDVAQKLGIKLVPIVGKGTLLEATEFAQKGFTSTWSNFLAEGLVVKPKVDMLTRNGYPLIAKIKMKDF